MRKKITSSIDAALDHIAQAKKIVQDHMMLPIAKGTANSVKEEMLRRIQAVEHLRDAELWTRRLQAIASAA